MFGALIFHDYLFQIVDIFYPPCRLLVMLAKIWNLRLCSDESPWTVTLYWQQSGVLKEAGLLWPSDLNNSCKKDWWTQQQWIKNSTQKKFIFCFHNSKYLVKQFKHNLECKLSQISTWMNLISSNIAYYFFTATSHNANYLLSFMSWISKCLERQNF